MSGWKIGYAECDITPRPGQALMAGFGKERCADGALAPLRAQALALQDPVGSRSLLLTAHVLGFERLGVEALRRAVKRAHGLPPQAVMLSASHTHWGPGISYRLNFSTGSLSVWYRKRL